MKKVINISLASIVFAIEEDAYERLSNYLEAIRKHFKKDKDQNEILEDIETGIAEKLLKKRGQKDKAINKKEVEKIIAAMGTPEDFDEGKTDKKSGGEESNDPERKLYRNPDDMIIAGVASGVAAYFNLDTALVRLAFFISVFFGGLGAAIYILLLIILPVANTQSEKFAMRGESLTLKEIEKSVKKGVEKLKKQDFGALDRFFRALGKGLRPAIKALLFIIGFALVIAGTASTFALSFGITWISTGASIPWTPYLLTDFLALEGTLYWLFIIALYVTLLVPFLLLFIVGLSILKRNLRIGLLPVTLLLIAWFAATGFIGAIGFDNQEQIESVILEIHEKTESNMLHYKYEAPPTQR